MADLRQVFNRNVTLSYMVNNPIKKPSFGSRARLYLMRDYVSY